MQPTTTSATIGQTGKRTRPGPPRKRAGTATAAGRTTALKAWPERTRRAKH